ncbi:ParB/Srx family N-terminal domain-containing protein [Vibrio sp. SCSIO 43140]|uniref:ParB/Srx family N-terminal domain-containing protein n=1 Tax=Vibrio sp. SCSIO 43140 TaxID=2819100 RepID=UPI002074AD43|nr:ParB/Srx family N-terminal domain-containing protein [Vibrio sp. SCSIO 43140]USD62327.1 ParB/Srx family N-terminal domain-containing protein [Vibrio sp. SCSIO 43140]
MKKTALGLLFASLLVGCNSSNNNGVTPLGQKGKVEHLAFSAGEVHWVTVGDLMPTQKTIGLLQNDYKLGRWQLEEEKLFEEFCETYGLRDSVDYYDDNSDFNDPESFKCKEPRESDGVISEDQNGDERIMDWINTVIVGPDGALYLTDGHHTFSRFHDMADGGKETKVLVRVEDNYAFDVDNNSLTMDAFWQKMQETKNVYLLDNGVAINPVDLPKDLGEANDENPNGLVNDDYRALVYYTRDIGWDKGDAESIPFLEYYWAEELRDIIRVDDADTIEKYVQAVLDASRYMVSLPSYYVLGDSGKTTAELGQLSELGISDTQGAIEEIICEWDQDNAAEGKLKLGKLGWAFYQSGTDIEDFPFPCNNLRDYENRYDLSR